MTCQCENGHCDHGYKACQNKATVELKTTYGTYKICRYCADHMMAEYVYSSKPLYEGETVKRTEIVMTRLDGRQPIEWWDQSEFSNRVTRIYTGDMKLAQEIPVPDELVLCDFCNDQIEQFPVPVFHGHALCPVCYQKYVTGGTN